MGFIDAGPGARVLQAVAGDREMAGQSKEKKVQGSAGTVAPIGHSGIPSMPAAMTPAAVAAYARSLVGPRGSTTSRRSIATATNVQKENK